MFTKVRNLALLASVASVAFFSLYDAHAEAPPPNFKVGVLIPLSGGNAAAAGIAIMNGIELARQENPDLLGRISFVYEDDQFDPKRDIASYSKLMVGSRVDALFGLGPALVYALAAALERDQVPLVNFGFVSAPVVGKPLIVRTMNHTDQYMLALATYMKRDGTRDFAVVDGEHFFLKAMTDSLRKGLGSDSTLLQIATVTPDEADFRSVIPKLRNYQNAKVGILLFPNSLMAFLQQARRMRFDGAFFGTDTCESAATLAKDPALVDGCIYPDNNATQSFQDSYRKKFGDRVHITFAANAYDMAVLVGEVFTREGKLKATEFVQALGKVQNRKGALGTFSLKDTADHGKFFEYPVYVKRMTQGRGEVVQ